MNTIESRVIGNNMKKFRTINNLTQEQIAEYIDVEVNYYSMCERGERQLSIPKLLLVIGYYNITPNDIFPNPNKKADEHREKYLEAIERELRLLPSEKLGCVLKFIESL